MRLWTVHPKYLDRAGLIALWREALLAQKVLRGRTRGYRHHPEVLRFAAAKYPLAAIRDYLVEVRKEGLKRGYRFKGSKINRTCSSCPRIKAQRALVKEEFGILLKKLKKRSYRDWKRIRTVRLIKLNQVFGFR